MYIVYIQTHLIQSVARYIMIGPSQIQSSTSGNSQYYKNVSQKYQLCAIFSKSWHFEYIKYNSARYSLVQLGTVLKRPTMCYILDSRHLKDIKYDTERLHIV